MKVRHPAWAASLVTRDRLVLLALAATIGLALALRLYGLDWDRGYSFTPHPDERSILMRVGEMGAPSIATFFDAEASPWNPRRFDYGSVPFYLLKTVQLLYSALPVDDLRDLRTTGRALSGLADAATVALVYLLGSRMYGRREGLLAAALVATAVIHIQLSHFYASDVLLALFSVAALFVLLGVARTGSLRLSALAGLLVGLGMATKVSQAPIYLAFIAAHVMYLFAVANAESRGESGLRDRLRTSVTGLAAGLGVSFVTFVVAEPYAFLDWQRFTSNVVEQSEMVRRIRDYVYTLQYVDTPAYWYQVQQLATWGLGWPLGVVAWGGLLYAALRGMRPDVGLAYLAVGWGLPIAILLYSSGLWAIVLASLVAFAALLATLPLRAPSSRAGVLLLSWVVPYLLITGAFEVKYLRYLIPVVPFLVLFGSRMCMALWDLLASRRPFLRPLLALGLVVLVGATSFYGVAYTSSYRQPHTAVRASEWINGNAPPGAVILKEHWEESLPGLGLYEVRELPMYERDDRGKLERVSGELADADYVVFYSNRLYGTIPRLPERYPLSSEYYRLLFSGELGYELAHVETRYPRLAGVTFVHDTLGRPGLPDPDLPALPERAIRLGFADESFSVYDHPVVLVLENTSRYDAGVISRRIERPVTAGEASNVRPGPVLTAGETDAQRAGGTWTEILRPGSLAGRWPVATWLILIEGIALLTLPIAFAVLSPLADRGYLLAKPLGLLLVGLAVWLLASLRWMPFSAGSIALCLAALCAVSTVLLVKQRREVVEMVRTHWKGLLVAEAVFLAAFLAFMALRMANPDLWHPFRGGEKPMDFAYLNAVLRSSYMPPYDPWFAGGFINYYYWGQFLVATLVKATGIDTAVAYNLAIPTFFAMTAACAYSVVYNLAEATRSRGRSVATRWPAAAAGITGAVFVCVLGNLDGAVQVGHGAWRALVRNMPFGEFDFWRSSRMMAPDPPGHEVTEFPFFTFLFADLHAHLMSMPFTILAVGIALAVVLGALRIGSGTRWGAGHVARLLLLGLTVGALRVLNTWDFPTYAALATGAILLAEYLAHGGWGLVVLGRAAAGTAFAMIAGFVAFLPYHLRYEAFFTGIERTTNTTVLWQFLGIHGVFVFIILSFLAYELRGWWLPTAAWAGRRLAGNTPAVRRAGVVGIGIALAALAVAVVVTGLTGSTIPFLTALAIPVALIGARAMLQGTRDGVPLAFTAMVVLTALFLAMGLDVFRVEGDIDRMNSVFKFYLHVWVLLALAAAYLLWRMGYGRGLRLPRGWPRRVWTGSLLVLLAAAAVYPVLGTRDRLRDRFDGAVTPLTLDGAAFMEDAVYWDQGGLIALSDDLQAIRWLKGATDGEPNVEGSPVLLEAQTPSYRWGGRVSVHTGLPGIVGWEWHQTQQRFGYSSEVQRRLQDVDTIYSTTSTSEALEILRRYNVEYVYVGELERLYYPKSGLAKFEAGLDGALDRVYDNADVTIYRLEAVE